jgi:hypothetical protein
VLEVLEARVAPATLVNATTVTYTDVDGDPVTVHVSAGKLQAADFTFNNSFATTGPQQLEALSLTDAGFEGASVSITAVRNVAQGGDGLVNVGRIDATGRHLGAVIVKGDLGKILAGPTGATSGVALASLSVQSMGRLGLTTQGGTGDLNSVLDGRLGTLAVQSDFAGAFLNVTAGTGGTIGSVTIGGSLVGIGTATKSGRIEASANIGPVTVRGDIVGAGGTDSGTIRSLGNVASLSVGGSIRGGGGDGSGSVLVLGTMGATAVGGSLVGSTGFQSGRIQVGGVWQSLVIGGSIIGSAGEVSGTVTTSGLLGSLLVRGDIRGGSGDGSALISLGQETRHVTVAGSLVGGAGANSGAIASVNAIGIVTVGGDVRGGLGQGSGDIEETSRQTSGIASVTIQGSLIGGGNATNSASGRIFSASSLGPVVIGGSVVGAAGPSSGSIIAGTSLGAVRIGGALQGGTAATSGAVEAQSGSLASLAVGGSVTGGAGTDSGSIKTIGGGMGPVVIHGSLVGGTTSNSGNVVSGGSISGLVNGVPTGVTIGGSLVGGTTDGTGQVFASADIAAVTIGGDLQGGGGEFAGAVVSNGRIASVTVRGSIRAGSVARAACIEAGADLGPILVGGSIIGTASAGVLISAVGQAKPVPGTDLAIRSLTVLGDVSFTDILGGYSEGLSNPVNADAQIGAVFVGGDWIATNLVAGVAPDANGRFGTSGNTLITDANQNPATDSSIGSVVIAGQVLGGTVSTDHFGIAAQLVAALTVGGTKLALTAGPDNDTSTTSPSLNLGSSNEVRVLEV